MNIGPWHRPRGYRVAPRTVGEIRAVAQRARVLLGVTGPELDLDMVSLLENKLRKHGIHFHIVSPDQLPGDAARIEPETGRLLITEPAYDSIHERDPNFQLLIPHELAHLALEHVVTFARTNTGDAHSALEDSEVQADVFSHEFVMPVHQVKRRCQTVDDIARVFNVPKKDARIRAGVLRGDGILILG